MMQKVDLVWNVIPACVYGYLAQLKGEESHYHPMFGKGVYLFIHGNGRRYQVYYIGKSNDDIGKRLASHYQKYAGTAVSDYWLPKKAECFNGDIYKLFNDDATGGKHFMQEGEGFSNEERRKVGEEIMKNTLFAFARVADEQPDFLQEIEAALQFALLKANGLVKHGWIGEKTSVEPSIELELKNIYTNSKKYKMKKMISTSLPDKKYDNIVISSHEIS